jgi:hypothetical protein
VRKLSKSAKARAKKRARKTQAQENKDADDGGGEHGTDVGDREDIGNEAAELTAGKGKKRARVAAMDEAGG